MTNTSNKKGLFYCCNEAVFTAMFSLIGWFPVPAIIYLGYWIAIQFLGNFSGEQGVAFWAHVGGFVAGVVLVRGFDGGSSGGAHYRR